MPSVAVAAPSAPRLDLTASLPPEVNRDSLQVRAAFVTFERAYETAIERILLAPGPNGTIVPAANRMAFDASVKVALEALADDLVDTLDVTSSDPDVATKVVDAIVGDDPGSLESRLLALPTVAVVPTRQAIISPVAAGAGVPIPLTSSVVVNGERFTPTPLIPIPQALASATSVASPAPTTSPADLAQKVRDAFGTFLEDYFHALKDVLLADQAGQADPKASRDAFDARVDRALQWLGDGLYVTLRRDPAVSGLAPRVRDAIEGQGPSSLRALLQGLPTPDNSQATLVREFTLGSVKFVAQALSLISGEVAAAVGSR